MIRKLRMLPHVVELILTIHNNILDSSVQSCTVVACFEFVGWHRRVLLHSSATPLLAICPPLYPSHSAKPVKSSVYILARPWSSTHI
eukprot:6182325-Pleurochrysis_carterae.AAC.8